MALNLYHKDCPGCASTIEAKATECGCGYVFTAEVKVNSQNSDQESLYLAYLAARLHQAVSEVETHQAQLAQKPDDFRCIANLMRAVREAQSVRAEFETQKSLLDRVDVDFSGPETSSESNQSTQATEHFRNQQASKAAQAMGANYALGRKQCPQCHAPTPASAARCECGNFFHIGPPLSTSLLASGISVTDHAAPAQQQKNR